MEGVDEEVFARFAAADDEVTRITDAFAAKADALGDLDVDERERDGNALA